MLENIATASIEQNSTQVIAEATEAMHALQKNDMQTRQALGENVMSEFMQSRRQHESLSSAAQGDHSELTEQLKSGAKHHDK